MTSTVSRHNIACTYADQTIAEGAAPVGACRHCHGTEEHRADCRWWREWSVMAEPTEGPW